MWLEVVQGEAGGWAGVAPPRPFPGPPRTLVLEAPQGLSAKGDAIRSEVCVRLM